MEIKENEWYKIGGTTAFRKCKSIEKGKDYILYDEGITNGEYSKQTRPTTCGGLERFRLATYEELAGIVPNYTMNYEIF
jgi:hypothetical protein